MFSYILFFFIICVGTILTPKLRYHKWFVVVSMFFLWLLIGLRDISVGTDTRSYVEEFNTISRLSMSNMWVQAFDNKEPLYVIISWLISSISNDYTFYLLSWALFPVVSFYVTFKKELKNSYDCLIAIVVFFLLGLYAFYVAGIRQTAALSIILLSYKTLYQKKLLKFLIYVFIASFIHSSAIIFIIAYPLCFLEIHWWYIFILVGVVFISNLIDLSTVFIVSKYFFGEKYESYEVGYESTQSSSALIMQIILFLICFFKKNRLKEADSSNNVLLILSFVGIIFQSLAGMLAEMSRISFYFCISDIIIVPRALNEYSKGKTRSLIKLMFVVVCIIYLFFLTSANLPDYKFSFT